MKTATIGELRQRFSEDLQVLMNNKAHGSIRRKAAQDMEKIQSDLFDAGYKITVTIGVEHNK